MGAGALVVEEGEVERGGREGEAGEEVGDETHLLDKQCRFLDGASRSEPVSEIIRVVVTVFERFGTFGIIPRLAWTTEISCGRLKLPR